MKNFKDNSMAAIVVKYSSWRFEWLGMGNDSFSKSYQDNENTDLFFMDIYFFYWLFLPSFFIHLFFLLSFLFLTELLTCMSLYVCIYARVWRLGKDPVTHKVYIPHHSLLEKYNNTSISLLVMVVMVCVGPIMVLVMVIIMLLLLLLFVTTLIIYIIRIEMMQ